MTIRLSPVTRHPPRRVFDLSLASILLVLLVASGATSETLVPPLVQPWEATEGLPAARQGRFPVMMPKYEGVDQLLVLSSRWVIVVTSNIEAVYGKIGELSGGKFFKAIADWEASEKAGKPNWTAYKGRWQIYDDFAAKARDVAGERLLDVPGYYAVTGEDGQAQAPKRVTRVIVGLGENVGPAKGKLRGASPVFYAHYSYLEMPSPLQQGKRYTIALKDGRKVTFVYHET
ncbi:MAG: hypothetical protein FJ278_18655, partial [Planctomycetes bacterium]|nr:hypothetical protein [Planctomycetota bacterium]